MEDQEDIVLSLHHHFNKLQEQFLLYQVLHLEENLAAWGTVLSADVLAEIDAIRKDLRDPAQ